MLYATAVTQAPYGRRLLLPLSFMLAILLAAFPASAADVVGKVILSIGQNQATTPDGQVRKLARKAEVYADDLLATSAKGRLQIRFTDGSRLSLRASSEFKITEYRFDAAEPTEGKAIYKLLKGGMRTLSGQIGKVDKEDYRLETTVATIGIRGTDFVIVKNGDSVTGSVNSGEINVAGIDGSRTENIAAGESFVIQTEGAIQVFETPATSETGEGSAAEGDSEETEESEQSSEEDTDEGSADGDDQAGSDDANGQNSNEDTDGSQTASATGSGVLVSGESTETSEVSLNINTDSALLPDTSIPATDPQESNTQTNPSIAPNPTGNGVLAPDNSVVAVAFTESEAGVLRSGNGSVPVASGSTVMIDSSGSSGDVVTGINYVDSTGRSSAPCSPCTFTSPSSLGVVRAAGSTTLGGVKVSWGRWDSGFSLIENGVATETSGGFSFMYANSMTTAAEMATVIAGKTGSYLYSFSPGSQSMTAPQIENGSTGSLIGYGDNSVSKAAGQLYYGTYMVVDWDTQKISQTSVVAQIHDGTDIRTYKLEDSSQVDLSAVLNGSQVSLTGTCSGSTCTNVETDTTLSGQMSVNFIGGQADGAVTSYGASGVTPGGTTATVSGTALLQNNGLAP
ncbi:FecR family protein [Aliamphritea ceti]|uniref:FecR family protein n=1 Tax=Aliamphritea ceti TaxID=1524258 RepID=UPI0021C338A8|nr:FecR family protein [Aliamphritea ceti]